MDAFFELKAINTQGDEKELEKDKSPSQSGDKESLDSLVEQHKLPYSEENKEQYANALVAERLVYAMTKLSVKKDVIEKFIKYVSSVEILNSVYQDCLFSYLKDSKDEPA